MIDKSPTSDDRNFTMDYEVSLRREVREAEEKAESACRSWVESTAHPASASYKSTKDMALMACGTWLGLLRAQALFTGHDDAEQVYIEKFRLWMGQEEPTPCEHLNISERATHDDGHQTARCFDCDTVITIGEETP